jgi:hypothetical protein
MLRNLLISLKLMHRICSHLRGKRLAAHTLPGLELVREPLTGEDPFGQLQGTSFGQTKQDGLRYGHEIGFCREGCRWAPGGGKAASDTG